MKYIQKNKNYSYHAVSLFKNIITPVLLGLIFFSISGCSDEALDTSKFVSRQNNDFKLTLTVSDDIVRSDDSIKLTARIERLIDKDSLASPVVSYKMRMDAVGGEIDGHSFSSASSISVIIQDDSSSVFEALSFFKPSSSSSTGHVSASFDGINVSMSIDIVKPR